MLTAMPWANRLAWAIDELHLVEQQRLLHRRLQQLDLPRRLVGDAEVADLAGRVQAGRRPSPRRRARPACRDGAAAARRDSRCCSAFSEPSTASMMCSDEKSKIALPDAGLGLDHDALAIGGRQLHRVAEARLADMRRAAIDIGVVDHGDAGIHRGVEQRADIGIAHLGDAHQAQHDAGHREVGVRSFEGFHGSA